MFPRTFRMSLKFWTLWLTNCYLKDCLSHSECTKSLPDHKPCICLEVWSQGLEGQHRAAGYQPPAFSSPGPSWPRTGAPSFALPREASVMGLENRANDLDAGSNLAPGSQLYLLPLVSASCPSVPVALAILQSTPT